MTAAIDLAKSRCKPCEGGVSPLSTDEITKLLKQLKDWEHTGGVIAKTYAFKNYYQAMAFVNAAAWISHREDHHPDITVGYNQWVCPRTILFARPSSMRYLICDGP
jgi:4a-hydroxytetrahydrobiopterin dehydratase